MKKRSFNRGMHTLMSKGYSKQSAFNKMRGLANKNNNQYTTIKVPSWIRYLGALILELILILYKVPSKEDAQIMLIQTIIPLSETTKPLIGFVTIIAIVMQIVTLLLIYDLLIKIYKAIKK